MIERTMDALEARIKDLELTAELRKEDVDNLMDKNLQLQTSYDALQEELSRCKGRLNAHNIRLNHLEQPPKGETNE